MKRKKEFPKEEKRTNLSRTIAEINKAYGQGTLKYGNELKPIEYIPTGIEPLDRILSGGFPKGRISELHGLPASGKSLICLLTIKSAQLLGLSCFWINAEHSFDPIFAEKLGIDTKKLTVLDLSSGENVIDILAKLLLAEPGLIVIDSIASLIPDTDMEKSMKENTIATLARLMSRGVRKLNALNRVSCMIFINQLREALTKWGSMGTTSPGGRSIPHYASIMLEVKKGDLLYEGDKKTGNVIGQIVQCYTSKNKSGQPFKRCSFKFFFEDCKLV